MHAVFWFCGYNDHDEGMIDRLASAFHMVIHDNPDMFGG
jgi:hypothetical protein